MSLFFRVAFLIIFQGIAISLSAQQLVSKRSSFYVVTGTSGAKLNQFDEMLAERGLSGLRNRYQSIGLGYQARINDFVLGMELYQNLGKKSEFDGYNLSYRTSRALFNVGYAFTEESRFQLIHYMSLGVGYLNFQMIPEDQPANLHYFLADPAEGFILRKKDIQKGTSNFGNFLTEIGFQLSYDFDLPGREEAVQIMAKVGYSFSPFEGKWNMADMAFDNTQSGAFVRVGAGISLPDRNFFYKDASVGIYLIKPVHFTAPDEFNEQLVAAGYNPLEGSPSNFGLRILGETERLLYGAEVYNLSQTGDASNTQTQTLNSLRVYANGGLKFLQFKNFGLGGLAGIGFGNIKYTLAQNVKPDFPELFEQRDFDGFLKKSGLMMKPEIFAEFGLPMTKRKFFDLVFSAAAGYELPIGGYRLGEFDMVNYMAGPYVSFGIGVRP